MNTEFQKLPFFGGLSKENADELMLKANIFEKEYQKDEIIILADDDVPNFGIVLSGEIYIEKDDIDGNTAIVSCIKKYGVFAEAFACSGHKATVNVRAGGNCRILWINYSSLLNDNISSGCKGAVLSRLLKSSKEKNIFLTGRIEHLTKHTLREKVLSYLTSRSAMLKSKTFTVPFDRKAMADYLGADRSALSAVLCKMRDSGEIEFHKNQFTLHI